MKNNQKKVIILGAGPSGLSLAYNLLKSSNDFVPILIEKSDRVGGLCATHYFDEFGVDFCAHKFKDKKLFNDLISELNIENDSFLKTNNFAFFNGINFCNFSMENLPKNLGARGFLQYFVSNVYSKLFKNQSKNSENFLLTKYGKTFYTLYLEPLFDKLLFSKIDSLTKDFPDDFIEDFSINKFIKKEEFYYPKFGHSDIWNKMATFIVNNGGKIFLNSGFEGFKFEKDLVLTALYKNNGIIYEQSADYFASSIPISEILRALDVPFNIKQYGFNLKYIDLLQVNFYLDNKNINENLQNNSTLYSVDKNSNIFKIFNLNNFSPYLSGDFYNKCVLSVLFSQKCSQMLNFSDSEIVELATKECAKYNLFYKSDINKTKVLKLKNAFPRYSIDCKNLDKIDNALKYYKNLFTIGASGQFKVLNMAKSMESGQNVAKIIMDKG